MCVGLIHETAVWALGPVGLWGDHCTALHCSLPETRGECWGARGGRGGAGRGAQGLGVVCCPAEAGWRTAGRVRPRLAGDMTLVGRVRWLSGGMDVELC